MPGLFEQFPHTNLHELNLDWLIDMLNQFKEELEDSAVLSVNGQTGHVTLYESENVILPPLPEGVDQWRLVRLVNGQYVGILFYNGNAYIQRGNETMRLLTPEDIPTSAGVVSWNGMTGIVRVTGADIPIDDTADADSIAQAIENEHTERVNADNNLRNSIDSIGSFVATTQHTTNVPSENSFHTVDTITPDPGYYLVISNISFENNAEDIRSASLSLQSNIPDTGWFYNEMAAPTGSTTFQIIRYHTFSQGQSMYTVVRQTSGVALDVTCRTFAIKLRN